ncbi:MAG: DUF1566 domain-containing protein [Candidatus Binatia bacterium]
MKRLTKFTMFVSAACLLAAAAPALAALTPETKCEVGKLKTVAAYASCRLKTEAKGLTQNLTPDFTKCVSKIDTKFPKLEESAGPGVCPSENDLVDIRDRTDVFTTETAILLSGGMLPPTDCGDGMVDLGEDCDLSNLDGETCASQGFYNGELACSPGCDFVTSGCNATRFEDNGATLLDHETGLEWEKKDSADMVANLANPHDADNTYTWAVAGSSTTQSGSAYSDFLFKLNGVVDHLTTTTSGCFENHCDWRIPTVDELKTILDVGCMAGPCVIDAMLLPNRSGRYWSNSTRASAPAGAYLAEFAVTMFAPVFSDVKTSAYFTRAVRTAP